MSLNRMIDRITDSDFSGGTPELLPTVSRYTARGVLYNDEQHVAMMYMSKLNLYKLPGGGIEQGDRAEEAFAREVREETGFTAEQIHELGYIEEHKNRNQYFQYSYCYLARTIERKSDVALTTSEIELGMEVHWMSQERAIEEMAAALNHCDDYSTKFMLMRDHMILMEAAKVTR